MAHSNDGRFSPCRCATLHILSHIKVALEALTAFTPWAKMPTSILSEASPIEVILDRGDTPNR